MCTLKKVDLSKLSLYLQMFLVIVQPSLVLYFSMIQMAVP